MSDWITDRLPTEADADSDGEVAFRRHPNSDQFRYMHWSYVGPNLPWRHTGLFVSSATPEPEPVDAEFTPPTAETPWPIRTGTAPFYVMVASDDSGAGRGGKPITWETQISEGGTLQAALRQQRLVGNRCSTTFIAECRIIPELTRNV